MMVLRAFLSFCVNILCYAIKDKNRWVFWNGIFPFLDRPACAMDALVRLGESIQLYFGCPCIQMYKYICPITQ